MTKRITLLRGQVTLVDDSDFPTLAQYPWRLNSSGYAVRTEKRGDRAFVVCLHRELMQAERGQIVDHVDHDKLNNTRSNLRIITQQENLQYRRCFRNNRSGYKGVTRQHGKWHARITVGGKLLHLGFYDDPETAARVYDAAARMLFDEYALLNFPDESLDATYTDIVQKRLLALG